MLVGPVLGHAARLNQLEDFAFSWHWDEIARWRSDEAGSHVTTGIGIGIGREDVGVVLAEVLSVAVYD